MAKGPIATRVDSTWVKSRLAERGRYLADLARAVDRDRTVVSRIVAGHAPMPLWMAPHFAKVLDVSEIEVLRRAGLQQLQAQTAPVISWVAASEFADTGEPSLLNAGHAVAFSYPKPLYALEVRGDSMDRVAPEGSIIAVSFTERDALDKDLGIFRMNGEMTFKRFRRQDGRIWLAPDSFSERHAPIVPSGDQEIEMLGRVVGIPTLARN